MKLVANFPFKNMSESGIHDHGCHIINILDRNCYNETTAPATSHNKLLPTANAQSNLPSSVFEWRSLVRKSPPWS